MKKSIIVTMCLGILIALVGMIMGFRGYKNSAYLVNIGIIVFIIMLAKMFIKREKPDERDLKVSGKAVSYSWFVSYILIAFLIQLTHLKIITITAVQALSMVFFTMAVTQIISRFIISRGNV